MEMRRRSSIITESELLREEVNEDKDRRGSMFLRLRSLIFSSEKKVQAFCLAFRLLNALLVETYFNPDEHWQVLEVAHRIVFGYGHLTWEWKEGIRSYLHPLIFALLYRIMAWFHLDTPWFMRKAPRLLQSVFASFGDLYLYKFSRLIFDEQTARWALFCQLGNWFMFYCITRTLSNSLETVLTIISLFYWVSSKGSVEKGSSNFRKLALLVAGLSCSIRPTSAVTWLYVGMIILWNTSDRLSFIIFEVVPIGIMVLIFTCFLDWWMYGTWVMVPFNFFRFNFLSSGGDYYGTHRWHWYLSQGFPAMVWTFSPFVVLGIFKSKNWMLSGLFIWVLAIYSILGHKEFRFVLPVLPLALMFSGYYLATMSKCDLRSKGANLLTRHSYRKCLAVIFLIITNVPMALYMSLVHQRGSEDAVYFLAKEAANGRVDSILFLMPCHSTPYYSSLHSNLPMQFLDCTPRFSSVDKNAMDESDSFMSKPVEFTAHLFRNSPLPSHIVLFDSEEFLLKELLHLHSFREVKRFFHAHVKVDRDLQSSVAIYVKIEEG